MRAHILRKIKVLSKRSYIQTKRRLKDRFMSPGRSLSQPTYKMTFRVAKQYFTNERSE